jgi:hypothetical protein
MKTLTQITCSNCADDGKPSAAIKPPIINPKTPPKFWRQIRQTARGFIAESSAGAQVLIPQSEINALIEAHETKFCVPK